jgi:hypothetical protein
MQLGETAPVVYQAVEGLRLPAGALRVLRELHLGQVVLSH